MNEGKTLKKSTNKSQMAVKMAAKKAVNIQIVSSQAANETKQNSER